MVTSVETLRTVEVLPVRGGRRRPAGHHPGIIGPALSATTRSGLRVAAGPPMPRPARTGSLCVPVRRASPSRRIQAQACAPWIRSVSFSLPRPMAWLPAERAARTAPSAAARPHARAACRHWRSRAAAPRRRDRTRRRCCRTRRAPGASQGCSRARCSTGRGRPPVSR